MIQCKKCGKMIEVPKYVPTEDEVNSKAFAFGTVEGNCPRCGISYRCVRPSTLKLKVTRWEGK